MPRGSVFGSTTSRRSTGAALRRSTAHAAAGRRMQPGGARNRQDATDDDGTGGSSASAARAAPSLTHAALTPQQVIRATELYNAGDGTLRSVVAALDELGLVAPRGYVLMQRVEALAPGFSRGPMDAIDGRAKNDDSDAHVSAAVFLHIINELWVLMSRATDERNLIRNAYDVVQIADMTAPEGESSGWGGECGDEGEDDRGLVVLDYGLGSPGNDSFTLQSRRDPDALKRMDAAQLAADPIRTILSCVRAKSLRDFCNFFTHEHTDPELINAFRRLGARETDIGFVLDSDELTDRCLASGLSDSEVRAVLNVFDEDSNGTIELDEFCRVMLGDQLRAAAIDPNLVQGLKRLLGREDDRRDPSRNKRNGVRGWSGAGGRLMSARARGGAGNGGGSLGSGLLPVLQQQQQSSHRAGSGGSASGRGSAGLRRRGSLTLLDHVDLSANDVLHDMQSGDYSASEELQLLVHLHEELAACEGEVELLGEYAAQIDRLRRLAAKGCFATHYSPRTGRDESPVSPTPLLVSPPGAAAPRTPRRPRLPDLARVKQRRAHPRHRAQKCDFTERLARLRLGVAEASTSTNTSTSARELPRYRQQMHEEQQLFIASKRARAPAALLGAPLPPLAAPVPRAPAAPQSAPAADADAPSLPPISASLLRDAIRGAARGHSGLDPDAPLGESPISRVSDAMRCPPLVLRPRSPCTARVAHCAPQSSFSSAACVYKSGSASARSAHDKTPSATPRARERRPPPPQLIAV